MVDESGSGRGGMGFHYMKPRVSYDFAKPVATT